MDADGNATVPRGLQERVLTNRTAAAPDASDVPRPTPMPGVSQGKVQQFLKSLSPPPETDADNLLSVRLANGSRIMSLPGDGDSIRGFSAPALVIEDEAAFVSDALYNAVRPMLAVSKNARLILVSTPHGRRGHFYEAWSNGHASWERESITAHDVPKITKEFLEQERQNIGPWWLCQ